MTRLGTDQILVDFANNASEALFGYREAAEGDMLMKIRRLVELEKSVLKRGSRCHPRRRMTTPGFLQNVVRHAAARKHFSVVAYTSSTSVIVAPARNRTIRKRNIRSGLPNRKMPLNGPPRLKKSGYDSIPTGSSRFAEQPGRILFVPRNSLSHPLVKPHFCVPAQVLDLGARHCVAFVVSWAVFDEVE